MTCEQLDGLIEEVAAGEALADAADAHVAACPRCQQRVRLAQDLARLLAGREPIEVPDGFADGVMARVQQDQWRSEQWLDAGFNVAIAAGVAMILAGVAGVAWSFGWMTTDRPTVEVVTRALAPWLASLAAEVQTVAVAALLLTSALGLWWWAEDEVTW